MRKYLSSVLLIVFLLSVLSVISVSAQDEVTLRWRTRPSNQAEIEVYQALSDTIDEAWDGVTLVYEPGGSEGMDYFVSLQTELESGTAPDVFWIGGANLADFVNRGDLYNLYDLAMATEDFDAEAFYPQPMGELMYNPETMSMEGALWGLPRDVSAMAIYYNADLFAEAGIPTPMERVEAGEWDWNTFAEDAAAINDLGDEVTGFAMGNWWANWWLFVNAAGGGFFNEDRTACGLNTPETTEALTFLSDLYSSGAALPYGTPAEEAFLAGTLGMYMTGRWDTPNFLANATFDWNAAEVPAYPGGSASNWVFWGPYVVNANTEHPEEAWQLLQYLTLTEAQAAVAELGANIPSRSGEDAVNAFLGTLEEELPDLNNEAWIAGLGYAVPEAPLWAANFGEIDAVVEAGITQVLTGELSAEEFTGSICDQIDPLFEAAGS
jgi:multiple sugar transport system substrate-binding protein